MEWRMVTERRALVAAAPILCAVHCAAGPLLVVAAPALAPSAAVEWAMFAVTLTVVAGLVVHRGGVCWRQWSSRLVVMGAAVWAGSLAGVFEPLPEVATTIVGTVAMAAGLLSITRVPRRDPCDCVGCAADERSDTAEASASWRRAAPSPRSH